MSFEPGADWQFEENGEQHATESISSGSNNANAEDIVELDSEDFEHDTDHSNQLNEQFPEATQALNALHSQYNVYGINHPTSQNDSSECRETGEGEREQQEVLYDSESQYGSEEPNNSDDHEDHDDINNSDDPNNTEEHGKYEEHGEPVEQQEYDSSEQEEVQSTDENHRAGALNNNTEPSDDEINCSSEIESVTTSHNKGLGHRQHLPEDNQLVLNRLNRHIRELETKQFDLQRQLHQSNLECESVRAAHRRLEIRADQEATQLKSLRETSSRERARLEASVVESKSLVETLRIELVSKERGFNSLKDRFQQQSASLAALHEQVDELQRQRRENETTIQRLKSEENRSSKQLAFLTKELGDALDKTAQSQAELDLQRQTLSRIHSEARKEALAELASEQLNGRLSNLRDDEDERIWRKQYIVLRRQMDELLAEIENREPEISSLQAAHEEAEKKLSEAQEQLVRIESERYELESKARNAERRYNDLALHQSMTEQVSNDLRRQLLVLLTDKALASTGFEPLSPEEEDELCRLRDQVARSDRELEEELNTKYGTTVNGERLINERLLIFRDVAELQSQNEALIIACKELAGQLDPQGNTLSKFRSKVYESSSEEMEAATGALESLQQKFIAVRQDLERYKAKELQDSQTIEEQKFTIDQYKSRVGQLQHELKETSQRFTENSVVLTDASSANNSKIEEELLRSQLKNSELRCRDLKLEFDQVHEDFVQLSKQLAHAQHELGRAEQRLAVSDLQTHELKAQLANAQQDISNLRKENQHLHVCEQNMVSQIAQLRTEAEQNNYPELQFKLINQMNKIEALVASQKSAHAFTESSQIDDVSKLDELQKQLDLQSIEIKEKEQKVVELENKVAQLSQTPKSNGADYSTTIESLKLELASSENAKNELASQVSALQQQLIEEKTKAQARDDELVEQVNNLEDQITEAQIKVDELAYKNSKLSEDLNSQTHEFKNQLEKSNFRIEELVSQVEESNRKILEATKRADEAEELLKLSKPAEISHEQSTANKESFDVQQIEDKLRKELEDKIKNELTTSQHFSNPSMGSASLDLSKINDLDSSKEVLLQIVDLDTLNKFEKLVTENEQARTKEKIKLKLEEVRAEAFKQGEESATRRSGMKSKLKDQSISSLKTKNADLEKQVEELKIKVRRLKGGDQNEDPANSDKSGGQHPISGSLPLPVFPFHPSAFEPPKRFGFFEDNDAKKRKED